MVSFTTRSDRHGAAEVIAFTGDLDVATRRAARDALQVALREGTGPLVLDLSGIEFLDSTGLTVLVNTANEAERVARPFAIVAPPGQARRTLELSGLDEELRLLDAVDDAW